MSLSVKIYSLKKRQQTLTISSASYYRLTIALLFSYYRLTVSTLYLWRIYG
jgi:hypothetical protein